MQCVIKQISKPIFNGKRVNNGQSKNNKETRTLWRNKHKQTERANQPRCSSKVAKNFQPEKNRPSRHARPHGNGRSTRLLRQRY